MLTIASVLARPKSGPAPFSGDDVARLEAGVSRHLQEPYRFVCLTNMADEIDPTLGIEIIPIEHNWPGWWSKMELFRLPGPLLYFDLDTAITGDLTDIAEQAEEWQFTALRDFYREKGLGSGLMGWGVPMTRLYDEFTANPGHWWNHYMTRGDQAFIEDHVNLGAVARWQDVLPGQVVSYKAHVRATTRSHESGTGAVPGNARVICFHGKPKPAELPAGDPVREHYR